MQGEHQRQNIISTPPENDNSRHAVERDHNSQLLARITEAEALITEQYRSPNRPRYDGRTGKIVNNANEVLYNTIQAPDTLPSHSRSALVDFVEQPTVNDPELERLWQTATEDPRQHLANLDRALTSQLDAHGLNLSLIYLLSAIEPLRTGWIDANLAIKLELSSGLTPELAEQLRILNRLNTKKANALLRKVYAFFKAHVIVAQDHIRRELAQNRGYDHHSLTLDIFQFATEEMPLAKNYLVQKELQELANMNFPDDSHKEGALAGVGGGASDKYIYLYQHRLESYWNRRALGINQGYPLAQPILAIAPGYYGLYDISGKLTAVYPESAYDLDRAKQQDAQLSRSNEPDDEAYEIYEVINTPIPAMDAMGRRLAHPSNKLRKFNDIREFDTRLKSAGRRFFYDLEQINHEALHPVVDAQFMVANTEYIREIEGDRDRTQPIETEKFQQLLFPHTTFSTDQYEAYLDLTSLHMIKKIEDDFDIDISKCNLWLQRVFLNYLEAQDISTVERLQRFTRTFNEDGLTVFLTLEQDPTTAETIYSIAERFDEETARRIFDKFAEMVQASEKIRSYLQAEYAGSADLTEKVEQAIVDNLLKKGRETLRFAASKESTIDIAQWLDQLKIEIQIFANTFRAIKEAGLPVELEQFKQIELKRVSGLELAKDQKDQLRQMSEANWKDQGKLGEKISDDFNALLEDGQRLTRTEFYLVQHSQDILGCFRLDQQPDGSYYFGSVLARKDLAGSRIGETLLDEVFTALSTNRHITAHCSPLSPITSKYLDKYGFVVTDLVSYAEPDDTFDIELDNRPERRQEGLESVFAGKSYKELLAMEPAFQDNTNAQLRRYTFPIEYAIFTAEGRNLLQQEPKAVITAFQQEKNRGGSNSYQVIVGFERLADTSPVNQYGNRSGRLAAT